MGSNNNLQFPKEVFYNAHHSPVGAFASFTLGFPGNKGGLGLELGGPANQNIWIGLESLDGPYIEMLPFYANATGQNQTGASERERYVTIDQGAHKTTSQTMGIHPFLTDTIRRDFNVATDTFTAGDLTFSIYSPPKQVPDPALGDNEDLKFAILPAVVVELTVDNRKSNRARKTIIGFSGSDPYFGMRRFEDSEKDTLRGIAQGSKFGIASLSPDIYTALTWDIDETINEPNKDNLYNGLGYIGLLMADAPAGDITTYRFAVCFYRDGRATAGWDTHYYYTRLYNSIEDVAEYALTNFDKIKDLSQTVNAKLENSALSDDQKFMLAHSVRSYYGSTQMLVRDNKPVWVVNEGEYRMMNTFDLTVDQIFYELAMHPWTVRNELDLFVSRYTYQDNLHFPGDNTLYPGGISFTHDMGVSNCFSKAGYSSYERPWLTGCFSYMTHEQLVNWVCCAGVYIEQTNDIVWRDANLNILEKCLESMLNRDHPDPNKRDGVMSLDSSRTVDGAEITTYDSLDASLGQARGNIYLAGKCWAAYLILEKIFIDTNRLDLADTAHKQAALCASTLVENVTEEGYIPAVITDNTLPEGVKSEAVHSRIIPAIEGLIFPFLSGCCSSIIEGSEYSDLINALKHHLNTVLVQDTCIFPDRGWKLSSTSGNSWLSKIYLSQFVARHILRFKGDTVIGPPDHAHVEWLLDPRNAYWAWSDQMMNGVACGSKYYPRGVTSILWLLEDACTDRLVEIGL